MDARRPTPDCDAEIARSRGVEIAGERRKTGGKAARLTRLKKNGGISRCFLCCSFLARRITVLISSNRLAFRRLDEFDGVIWTGDWGETS